VNSLNRATRLTRANSIRLLGLLGMLMAVLFLQAESCGDAGGVIPNPPGTPTPCGFGCPPPAGPASNQNDVTLDRFSFYFTTPPWKKESSDKNNATLTRNTNYGQVTAQFFSGDVSSGATADQLLASWTRQNIDPNKFAALQDTGPIAGAEIGYVSGAGHTYAAVADLPNAPNTPLFIQVMSAVKGTSGIIFVVVSPLDPANPDPSSPVQVRSGAYDRLINTVFWH